MFNKFELFFAIINQNTRNKENKIKNETFLKISFINIDNFRKFCKRLNDYLPGSQKCATPGIKHDSWKLFVLFVHNYSPFYDFFEVNKVEEKQMFLPTNLT